jgi:hypothetical protein
MASSDTLDDIKSKGILWGFGVLTLAILVILTILGPGGEVSQDNSIFRMKPLNAQKKPIPQKYQLAIPIPTRLLISPKFYYIKAVATSLMM